RVVGRVGMVGIHGMAARSLGSPRPQLADCIREGCPPSPVSQESNWPDHGAMENILAGDARAVAQLPAAFAPQGSSRVMEATVDPGWVPCPDLRRIVIKSPPPRLIMISVRSTRLFVLWLLIAGL